PLNDLWCKEASGHIFDHVPFILSSDNLPRNVFKRWNKHMVFYLTLAGILPRLANQEHNFHY
ncbi:hypothetical protein DFH28DRAFT_877986, partial [Melampsora americana]